VRNVPAESNPQREAAARLPPGEKNRDAGTWPVTVRCGGNAKSLWRVSNIAFG
jgi:hypothetical protein